MTYEYEDEKPKFILNFRAWNRSMATGAGAERPVWEGRIDVGLKGVFEFGGSAELSLIQGAENAYTHSVSIDAEPGKFRLYAATNDSDQKNRFLIWWEPGDSPARGEILIRDDPWDARTVCTDLEVAMRIFRDMFDHGDLSEASLSEMRSQWNPKP